MSNNEEVVIHETYATTYKEFDTTEKTKRFTVRGFIDPRLSLCRSVFQEELDCGLTVPFSGSLESEDGPELTYLLDGLYKFGNRIQFNLKWMKTEYCTPAHVLSEVIASWYYDCMSAGMPRAAIIAARLLIKKSNCDLTETVYPGKDRDAPGETGWYTLGDFMESTTGIDEGVVK